MYSNSLYALTIKCSLVTSEKVPASQLFSITPLIYHKVHKDNKTTILFSTILVLFRALTACDLGNLIRKISPLLLLAVGFS